MTPTVRVQFYGQKFDHANNRWGIDVYHVLVNGRKVHEGGSFECQDYAGRLRVALGGTR